MGLRELKEAAHQQFVRGKFSQCAQTYQQVLRLAPQDPNMHVRHAEACRRAGDRLQAIASYRTAAELLLELGCESRARGALKAALELDPRDQLLQEVVDRLGLQHEEPFSSCISEDPGALPLLPSLDSSPDPVPPPLPAPHSQREVGPEEPRPASALPPIHRVVPAMQASRRAQASRPAVPPILTPVPASKGAVVPPPLPAKALIEAARGMPQAQLDAMPSVPNPSRGSGPRLEVRRLSPSAIAFRSSPQDGWAVIRSHTPLELHLVEDLEQLPPMMQDLPAELTVASDATAASATLH
jgi:tetratricopeptide (TPR) repeat protein